MSGLVAVTHASAIVFRRHVVRSLGGPLHALISGTVLLLATAAINVCMYRFCRTYLSSAFVPSATSHALQSARDTLIYSQLMLSAMIALGVLMLTLGSSPIGPAVRSAGGSARTLVLSECVPLLAVVAAATVVGEAGTTWFFATRREHAGLAALTLTTTAVGIAFAALAAFAIVVTVLRYCAPTVFCRIIAIVVLFIITGTVFGDMLAKAGTSTPSAAGLLIEWVWGGTSDLLGPRALLGAVGLLTGASAVLLGARALERPSDAFAHIPRIVSLPSIGASHRLVNAIPRETMLLLRHPVGQSTSVSACLLSALLVIGWWRGLIPETAALSGSAMLFSAGAETAFGRALPWIWARRTAGMRQRRLVAEQYLCTLPVGAIPITAIVCGAHVGAWQSALGSTLVLYLSLSAIAYLSGTILPFNDAAPTAAAATSLLTIVTETAVIWASSRIATPGSPASVVCDAVAGIAALGIACVVGGRRW